MIAFPTPGRPVQVWYRASVRSVTPWHGRTGVVVIPAAPHRGRGVESVRLSKGAMRCRRHRGPSNHGIDIDGTLVVVPCGNLRGVPGPAPSPAPETPTPPEPTPPGRPQGPPPATPTRSSPLGSRLRPARSDPRGTSKGDERCFLDVLGKTVFSSFARISYV